MAETMAFNTHKNTEICTPTFSSLLIVYGLPLGDAYSYE